ncbi:hypothetical protein ACK3SF_00575 [Candidatus Nanosalina sp. VS9-1]|uniref:hypothetical protein n=1 Tax=Candidatus Nanosalina sp. VS9-1 TaxID=3388566 RepID=UPI0039DF793F
MERKGISQVLFLIIAASVLMMVALTLIFMFQSGAGDTTQQAQTQTCISSVQAKCNSFGDEYVRMPGACITTVDGQRQMLPNTFAPHTQGANGYSSVSSLSGTSGAVYADCGEVS